MDTTTSARELEAVRQRRAEMHETLAALQRGLTTDADLGPALDRLASEFALHVEVTEGPDGLHQAILAGDLRLANQVDALAAEHRDLAADIAALVNAEAPSSQAVQDVIDRLVRHRQRGADLIYEAYQTDIGGAD